MSLGEGDQGIAGSPPRRALRLAADVARPLRGRLRGDEEPRVKTPVLGLRGDPVREGHERLVVDHQAAGTEDVDERDLVLEQRLPLELEALVVRGRRTRGIDREQDAALLERLTRGCHEHRAATVAERARVEPGVLDVRRRRHLGVARLDGTAGIDVHERGEGHCGLAPQHEDFGPGLGVTQQADRRRIARDGRHPETVTRQQRVDPRRHLGRRRRPGYGLAVQSDTSTIISTSTGASRGSAATPTAERACTPASPNALPRSSLAPLTTPG